MRNPDHKFFAKFAHVSVILAGVVIGQFALADPKEQAGSEEHADSEEPPVITADATSSAGAAAERPDGLEVYNEICVACHSPPGIGGAPALGDADAWAARIARGMDTLINNALNGYSGSTGIMPRKGGRIDLSDEEIIAAIEYMIEQVEQ